MHERLLENWLNKANERTFQVPFCYMLAAQGHKLIHLTRHCAMELGKDILTIAPDGVPCAFQLKGVGGGKLSLSQWRADAQPQMLDLTEAAILHPSFQGLPHHRSYLVINGELQEETSASISQINEGKRRAGHPEREIHVIVKGNLLDGFKRLRADFLPGELTDMKAFLEVHLCSGEGMLPKEKVAGVLENVLPPGTSLPTTEVKRAVAGLALVLSSLTSSFVAKNNHLAEIEAWTMYMSTSVGFCLRNSVPTSEISVELNIAAETMLGAMGRLADEVQKNPDAKGLHPVTDRLMRPYAITGLLGLLSAYGLYLEREVPADQLTDHRTFIRKWVVEQAEETHLWGDYAGPQVLAVVCYLRQISRSDLVDQVLEAGFYSIFSASNEDGGVGFPNAYMQPDEIIPFLLGESDPPFETIWGFSASAEHLLTIAIWDDNKSLAQKAWPHYTKLSCNRFIATDHTQVYSWANTTGVFKQQQPPPAGKWSELRASISTIDEAQVPTELFASLASGLSFLLCYPHRLNPDVVKFLLRKLSVP